MANVPKSRAGRLTAFAKAGPDYSAGTYVRRSDSPKIEEPTSSQEQQIKDEEAARNIAAPVPSRIQHDLGGPNRPIVLSPRNAGSMSRPNSEMYRKSLFEGSQLGESFMGSGRSTPLTEPDNVEVVEIAETINLKAPQRRSIDRGGHDQNRFTAAGRVPPVQPASFQMGEDGFIRVTNKATRRHDPAQMRDGFQAKPFARQPFPPPPDGQAPKLPLRDVKIRRPRNDVYSDYGGSIHEGYQPARPSRTSHNYHHSRQLSQEEEAEPAAAQENVQVTPKAARSRAPPSPVFAKASSPVAAALFASRERKRRRATPDYDDKALSSMAFSDLQHEAFDFDPALAGPQNMQGGQEDGLETKLEKHRPLNEFEQKHMFASLSMEDWEASGDWFCDQFSSLMHRLQAARRQKRALVQQFEDEAAGREEAVRLRSKAVDRKLVKMRQDGQKMVEAAES